MSAPRSRSGGGGCLLVIVAVLAVVALRDQLPLPGTSETGAAAAPGSYVAPAEGEVTSGYGSRWGTTHGGVDIANATGTPIVAVLDGDVVEAGPVSGFGLWARIRHPDGTVTVYGHMQRLDCHSGEHVTAGQQIATTGARGQATGAHLHFEVWPHGSRADRIDPAPWLANHGIHL